MADEYTPREHGLEDGDMWAEQFAGGRAELERVAAGDIPEDLN